MTKVVYTLRRFGNDGDVLVSKLNLDLEPLQAYKVNPEKFPKCTCPSRYQPCKHVKMRKAWEAEAEPSKFLVWNSPQDYKFVEAEDIDA